MVENMCEEEKMQVTSIFSLSHIVFKRPLRQSRKHSGSCGKGLNSTFLQFNSLPNNKILDKPKFKALGNYKINSGKKMFCEW